MNSRIDILRNGGVYRSITPDEGATMEDSYCGISTLSIEWDSPTPMNVEIGDYVEVCGRAFFFFSKPSEEMNSTMRYHYASRLYGEENMMNKTLCLFLDVFDRINIKSQNDYELNATPQEVMSLIVRNINRNVSNPWTYNVTDLEKAGEVVSLQVINSTCKNVLDNLCNKVGGEWCFDHSTRTITLSDKDKIEKDRGLRIEYPINALAPLKFTHNEDRITRMFVAGGRRNMPNGYADGESDRLLMPNGAKVLEIPSAIPIEGFYNNDDIYPRRNSQINGVRRTERGFYFVADTTLRFDINKQLVSGQTAKIAFNSGRLTGYEFEIASFNNTTKEIEIKQQTEGEYVIPNETMRPAIGDKYVLLDIVMPSQYVDDAEEELRQDAEEVFADKSKDKVKTDAPLSTRWLILNNRDIHLFDMVTVNHNGTDKVIRAVKVTRYPFGKSTYGRKIDVELSEFTPATAITQIRQDVAQLGTRLNNVQARQGNKNESTDRNTNRMDDALSWKVGDE